MRATASFSSGTKKGKADNQGGSLTITWKCPLSAGNWRRDLQDGTLGRLSYHLRYFQKTRKADIATPASPMIIQKAKGR